jgi:hypothetical protein
MGEPLTGRYEVAENGCWLWTAGSGGRGYPRVRFKGRSEGAHRVAFYLAHGYMPTIARHTCDTPLCINPAHLVDGTPADNSRDMVERGRSAVGERNPKAKLTWEDAEEIRNSRLSTYVLASRYDVHRATIKRIRAGSHWRAA